MTTLPPQAIAVRDLICAITRDAATILDSDTIAARLPTQTRWLARDGAALCADNHAALTQHACTNLLHCFGNSGHVVAYRLSTPEVYSHCQALHSGGYLQKFDASSRDGFPTRWLFIEPALATGHRQVEQFEAAEFAALAQLAGDPGPQR